MRIIRAIVLCWCVVMASGFSRGPIWVCKDHATRFSCGYYHYRTLLLDEKQSTVYVGGMERIFRLPADDISTTRCGRDFIALESSPDTVRRCVQMGQSEQPECRNHIKVILPMSGDRLYVCGTNARRPKDWVIHANLTHVRPKVYGIGNGLGKCPLGLNDNATAVWVEHGNPEDLVGLYSGTPVDLTNSDRIIFRSDLYDNATNQKKFSYVRTIKQNPNWLDKANFVGSFDIGDYVYFFFREAAVEAINVGKFVYSRVARVCKKDTGGASILKDKWATYVKARLNCSIPGEYPFYFNEIQSVYKMPDDDSIFFAIFTTQTNSDGGISGSAVCSYTLKSINDTFDGKFKGHVSWSSNWLPVHSYKVPTPRPGTCVNDTQSLPDKWLKFAREHPLMDSAVRHKGGRPIFHRQGVVFTTINAIRHEAEDDEYSVIYIGTRDGVIIKLVHGNVSGTHFSNVVDEMLIFHGEPIRSMVISPKRRTLYAAGDSSVVQLGLAICARHSTWKDCIHDPMCGWNEVWSKCLTYPKGNRCAGNVACLRTVAGK